MASILDQKTIHINLSEQYKKQTYSTRAYIRGPHQVETLTVPVKKYANHEIIKNIRIDYSENWHLRAWKTIENCYRNSPYFEYFEYLISPVFSGKFDFLVDLNTESLTVCLKILGVNKTICLNEFSYYDNQKRFITFNAKEREEKSTNYAYNQVFGSNFEPNLSILDMLFCEGRNSLSLLKTQK